MPGSDHCDSGRKLMISASEHAADKLIEQQEYCNRRMLVLFSRQKKQFSYHTSVLRSNKC